MTSTPASASEEAKPIVALLRAAGCVFAEEEAALLRAEAPTGPDLDTLVARRVAGEPLEYIVGWADFGGRRLSVTSGVFVPRHRSEFLAMRALDCARASADPVVLDLCCGAGAAAVTLAAALDRVTVHAADIDPAAVACSRRNLAEYAWHPEACHTWLGDLYAPLPTSLRGRVDVLVTNAPYVPTDEIALMPTEARLYEAPAALDSGEDGLALQRRVATDAPSWLSPGGSLVIETSARQAERTRDLLAAVGLLARIERSEEWDATVVIGIRQL
ncbi:putative protein N(5)-glutamine methyltransferase [Klugiella xanthotipulae]|uniref:peptide chain release factor N(5)-glutamine methyltransferase n=1 Tax=Klugiella xanthotipulae TaxID=244735 RepID=A0A543I6R7_9MICO|nr:putative protein N(5)-glutamine methyltransferase [Klugiella xanthotipulae]TQM66303.1 release factor glutamine methyltransferase [Klugiella xanthotipulae]